MKKIINFENLKILRRKYQNKKIGLAHGVFDLLHYGHLLHLKKAKQICDILVVSITADKFINKNPSGPYYNSKKRMEFLSEIECVDYVILSEYQSAIETLQTLKPNYYFKGSEYANYSQDYTGKIVREVNILKKNKGEIIFTNEPILSSSYMINNFFSSIKPEVKNFLLKNKKNIKFNEIWKNADKIKKDKVLVFGDVIIDEYIFSSALSKSPKEQIISVKEEKREIYNGGILATVNHVSNFVKDVTLLTLMGKESNDNKKYLSKLSKNIKKKIFYLSNNKTIIKTRYLDNDNKKIFQKTNNDFFLLDKKIENNILNYLKKNLSKFDQIIVNDFGHGLITEKIIKTLTKFSNKLCVNVQTNSANNGYNFITKYKKAFYISVDEPEARLATRKRLQDVNTLFKILEKKINFNICSITLGKKGTKVYSKDKFTYIPSISERPIDTMGAGDAYFAISSLFSKYLKKNIITLGLIGNIAGALKIQYLGHRDYVQSKKLLGYLKTLLNI